MRALVVLLVLALPALSHAQNYCSGGAPNGAHDGGEFCDTDTGNHIDTQTGAPARCGSRYSNWMAGWLACDANCAVDTSGCVPRATEIDITSDVDIIDSTLYPHNVVNEEALAMNGLLGAQFVLYSAIAADSAHLLEFRIPIEWKTGQAVTNVDVELWRLNEHHRDEEVIIDNTLGTMVWSWSTTLDPATDTEIYYMADSVANAFQFLAAYGNDNYMLQIRAGTPAPFYLTFTGHDSETIFSSRQGDYLYSWNTVDGDSLVPRLYMRFNNPGCESVYLNCLLEQETCDADDCICLNRAAVCAADMGCCATVTEECVATYQDALSCPVDIACSCTPVSDWGFCSAEVMQCPQDWINSNCVSRGSTDSCRIPKCDGWSFDAMLGAGCILVPDLDNDGLPDN